MQQFQPKIKNNPLSQWMRQPKIYIRLPSNGQYWPPGSIDMPENSELPVYSMTAKDELMFKTPDALMNGQGIVDVIQSCLPNIKDAWKCPTLDLDTILVAIRLATYGEKMPFKHTVPDTDEEVDYDLDLRQVLEQQSQNHWIEQVIINESLVVFVKPLTYRHMTQMSIKTFETQKILQVVNNDKLSDEKKMAYVNQSFKMLTNITTELMVDSIDRILSEDAEVTDKKVIAEFIENVDKAIFDIIQNHLAELKKHNDLKPLEFESTLEQQAAGAPAKYTIPLNFNESDFFA